MQAAQTRIPIGEKCIGDKRGLLFLFHLMWYFFVWHLNRKSCWILDNIVDGFVEKKIVIEYCYFYILNFLSKSSNNLWNLRVSHVVKYYEFLEKYCRVLIISGFELNFRNIQFRMCTSSKIKEDYILCIYG